MTTTEHICETCGEAYTARPPADAPAVEQVAEAIFAAFSYNETYEVKPAWVPGGNSLKQDEARRYARAALQVRVTGAVNDNSGIVITAATVDDLTDDVNSLLASLEDWARAYPTDLFREPDDAEREWLHATKPGLMDRIAASMGRHMAGHIADDLAKLRAALQAALGAPTTGRTIEAAWLTWVNSDRAASITEETYHRACFNAGWQAALGTANAGGEG